MTLKFGPWLSTLIAVALVSHSLAAQQAAESPSQDLPSGKEIIAKHIQATGGLEHWNAVKTLRTKAKLSIPEVGVEGQVTLVQTAEGKARAIAEIEQIGTQEQGTDGQTFWEMSNITGSEILSGERETQARMQFVINGQLHYEKWFQEIRCTGIEKFDGEDCYVLVLERENAQPATEYYSVAKGFQRGSKQHTVTQMGDLEIETTYDDYREVKGVKFPYSAVAKLPNGMSQKVEIESVELNPEVDAQLFELPAEVQALKK